MIVGALLGWLDPKVCAMAWWLDPKVLCKHCVAVPRFPALLLSARLQLAGHSLAHWLAR